MQKVNFNKAVFILYLENPKITDRGHINRNKLKPCWKQCFMTIVIERVDKTTMEVFTCPVLSSRPLYTRPNPPSPIKDSGWKFFVATASSRKVNVWAAIWPSGTSLGPDDSFFNPVLFLALSLSAPANFMKTRKCGSISSGISYIILFRLKSPISYNFRPWFHQDTTDYTKFEKTR